MGDRLISADALKVSVRKKFKDLPSRCEINGLVNAAPTIDAIPVEWLREMMHKPQMTRGNPFGFVLAEWLEEQEVDK